MKKLIVLVLLFATVKFADAQDYQVILSGGNFTPNETKVEFVNDIGTVPALHRSYPAVQFYQIPTTVEKKMMENAGIRFFQYLPNNAYLVSITSREQLTQFSHLIRSVFNIPVESKMDKYCRDMNFPDWALQRAGKIEVMVTYAKDINETEISQLLKSYINGAPIIQNELHGIRIEIEPNKVREIAEMPFVVFIGMVGKMNIEETKTRSGHRNNFIDRRGSGNLELRGKNISVALTDDGIIGPHIDFKGRIKESFAPGNSGNHADHCAGILAGAANRDPIAEGMASGADLYVYKINIPSSPTYSQGVDSLPVHYYSKNIRVLSNSYSEPIFQLHNALTQLIDQQQLDMPLSMYVFSAGNSGGADGGYGAGATWGNITGSFQQGKNIITVGNLTYNDELDITSSRGPAFDGRIKPEICAIGTNVYSTLEDNTYGLKSGTSMACPAISGILSQLLEGYKLQHSGNEAPGALMKCILLNTADDLGNPGPDFKYGFGRVNARRAYNLMNSNQFLSGNANQNDSLTFNINVPSGTGQLRVMIYWNDKEALPVAARALVNNLDLGVINPANQITFPYVLDPTPNPVNLDLPATRGVDTLNNMEQVVIDNPVSGNYTIYIKGTAVPFGPQTFYITYEFVNNTPVLTYPIGKESFTPGATETIRWDDYGNINSTYKLEYSLNNGGSWTTLSDNIPAVDRYYDWAIPNTSGMITGKGLMRVTRNGGGSSTSIQPFYILGVPTNTAVIWVCADSVKVSCNPVEGAIAYKLFALGEKYMDSIGISTTTEIIGHASFPLTSEGWYAIQAVGPDGAIGARSYAMPIPTNLIICPCNGQPSTGPISSPGFVCPGTNYTISIADQHLTNTTYQWQYSFTGLSGTWTNISGQTNPSASVSQLGDAYIRIFMVCHDTGLSDTSAPVLVKIDPLACAYCVSGPQYIGANNIFNITIGALNNSSVCGSLGPGPGSYSAGGYCNYYHYSITAPQLRQGSSQNFSINIGNCSGSNYSTVKIFIDFNGDGQFNETTEVAYFSPTYDFAPFTLTGSFTVPINATVGFTRMRVIAATLYSADNIHPCGTFTNGETEDYRVEITLGPPCTGVPSAASITGPSEICKDRKFTLSATDYTGGEGISFQWQQLNTVSSLWENIPGATSKNYSDPDGITQATDFRLVTKCSFSNQESYSNILNIHLLAQNVCYCIPEITNYTFSGNEKITKVIIGGITNTSTGYGDNGYEDFTSLAPINLTKNTIYPLSVTFSPAYLGDRFAAWIDFNQDGNFQDPEEKVLDFDLQYLTEVKNITIPSNARNGVTRMRLIIARTTTSFAPCSNQDYGNVEDYLINISPLCQPESVPYTAPIEYFTGGDLPDCMTAQNFNATGSGWHLITSPGYGFTGNYLISEATATNSGPMDAWVYTNGIQLNSTEDYVLSFRYGNTNAADRDKLGVFIGANATPAGMSTQLFVNENISIGGSVVTNIPFTVPSSGVYYIGFHGYSPEETPDLILGKIKVELASPTPVTMSNLRGWLSEENKAQLNWNTYTEINNAGFEVERSEDGIQFRKIGFVSSFAPNGNSNQMLNYRFNDAAPVNDISFYRIIQKDFDGGGYISNIVRLSVREHNKSEITLQAIPNPVTNGIVTIQINGQHHFPGKITIINPLGSIVRTYEVTEDKLLIDMNRFDAGVYMLQYNDKRGKASIKIIKN